MSNQRKKRTGNSTQMTQLALRSPRATFYADATAEMDKGREEASMLGKSEMASVLWNANCCVCAKTFINSQLKSVTIPNCSYP